MTTQMPRIIQPVQWLAALGLLAMMGITIKLAIAVTAYTPQTQPTGYTGQEIVTNGTLTSGNESLFRSNYEKQYWSGNLYDYPISAAGVVNSAAERWSGGVVPNLAAQNFSTGRFIGTMKDDGTKVPLLSASLSVTQQNALTTTVNAVSYNSTQITNFLRGDHSNESLTTLRQRFTPGGPTGTIATVLGDIIHSRPYYLADATNPTIFVGANDGMLHAFNTVNGTERWAYVPSMLLTKMNALAANPYVHDYYVDGQIAVGNAPIAGVSKRILVGALGAGGKGLYALNIDGSTGLTAASDQDAANKALWEITPTTVNYATPQMYDGTAYVAASGYANLGYTYSAPQIKTINNGGSAQQVVIVGNGYNSGGDYQAYLFIINAADGKLVKAIKADNTSANATGTAVTNGTAASPNGLFNTVAFDSNADGYVDTVYAGDLNGAMWKFNLLSATPSSWSSSVLYVTNPKQPITATPAALPHPSGSGYIVNFATGGIFSGTQPATGSLPTGDLGDTSTFAVYGIWDGAPASNTTLVSPTLTERCYNTAGTPSTPPCLSTETRVRRVSASTPNWAAGGNLGWKVALPVGGERVVGEGSFISSGRYYFTTYNPTISYLVPTTSTYVWGENWQMALDAVTGGSVAPFMDLNGDGAITSADRIKYTAAEGSAGAGAVNTPIMLPNVDGISVGKWVARGVQSQPTLVKLTSLFTTLFNTNPDVYFPPAAPVGTGVTGGHFDEDIYFGSVTASAAATATITVGSTNSAMPATLGGIQVNGVTIVPALSVADITDGTATNANATTIANKVSSGIYSATAQGNTVTITAPPGAAYNGQTLTILAGTSYSGGTPSSAPTNGTLVITDTAQNQTISLDCGGTYIGQSSQFTSSRSSTPSRRLSALYNNINNSTVNGYGMTCVQNQDPNTGATSSLSCSISAPVGASACPSGFNVPNITTTTNIGPSGGSAGSNWSNLAPALSTVNFSGGADGTTLGNTCTGGGGGNGGWGGSSGGSTCQQQTHVHQYDKIYDVTGVDMLNANNTAFNLEVAVPSTSQNFKVIMHNQYLNPAVMINIGNSNYLPNVNFGYTSVKSFTTSATLNLATLPTYNRNPGSTGSGLTTGPKYISSLVVNMPVDALTAKNWWGNGDVRAGLIPTTPQCVWSSVGTNDGNMFQPVNAPANNATLGYPADGPGTLGYSGSTTPATATGVRHGGALTIQIIRDTTPNSALELNDNLGRPEYGWRVKSSLYSTYVLAEYNTYWHHPNGLCFGDTGWSKAPGPDTGGNPPSPTHTPGATDPKLGTLSGSGGTGGTGTVSSVVITGNTTTITYTDGSSDVIVKVVNADGTLTTVNIHIPAGTGTATTVVNADRSVTVTVGGVAATIASGNSVTLSNGATVSNATTANSSGSTSSGGLLNQNAIGYRRISWKELIRN